MQSRRTERPVRGAPRDLPVSVPIAELTEPAAGAPRGARTAPTLPRGPRLYGLLAAAALLLGALSLLIPSTASYDPWSWLIWGREILHLNLHTTGGPTWKPLTVIFTTVFALFGKAAPDLWLVVARAGAVVAVAMVFRLCVRFVRAISGAGDGTLFAPAILGGLIAALSLASTGGFVSNSALGYSEGLMTALVLIAVERHLDGAPRQAFVVGFFAALDRPELWLFWGPYGLWLVWRDRSALPLVLGLFMLIPVLWFLPEYWGSGHFFRGVSRAHTPRSNSAAYASCPFCSELAKHAWPTVLLRVKVAAALAVLAAATLLTRAMHARETDPRRWRLTAPREHALAGVVATGVLGLTWWVLIAVLTQAGFSGNDRYLVLGAALIEIAGGVGYGWLAAVLARESAKRSDFVRTLGAGAGAAILAALVMALVYVFVPNPVGRSLIDIQRTHRSLVYQAQLRAGAANAVARLGGKNQIYACGTVMTEGFQVPLLAYSLGVHTDQVEAAPLELPPPGSAGPNVIFQARENRRAHRLPALRNWPETSYRLVARNRTFRIYEHCRV